MPVTLDELKNYLRVDFDDDDELLSGLLAAARNICIDVSRLDDSAFDSLSVAKTAVLYASAYLYEHREEADHKALTLTLRAMLFGEREAAF